MSRSPSPAILAAALALLLGLPLAIILLLSPTNNCDTSSTGAPAPGTQTAGQIVRYFESQGFQPAWRRGDHRQPRARRLQFGSSAQPMATGAEGSRSGAPAGTTSADPAASCRSTRSPASHGLTPASLPTQLEYLVWDVQTSYPQLISELNSASSPQEAATMFETAYEVCSGYVAYMVVIPGSPVQRHRPAHLRRTGARRRRRHRHRRGDRSARIAHHGRELLPGQHASRHGQRPAGVAAAPRERDAAELLEL